MCKGYFTPAGQSETVGVASVFTFNNIQASATVDEGNNWINLAWGPLSLTNPTVAGADGNYGGGEVGTPGLLPVRIEVRVGGGRPQPAPRTGQDRPAEQQHDRGDEQDPVAAQELMGAREQVGADVVR